MMKLDVKEKREIKERRDGGEGREEEWRNEGGSETEQILVGRRGRKGKEERFKKGGTEERYEGGGEEGKDEGRRGRMKGEEEGRGENIAKRSIS